MKLKSMNLENIRSHVKTGVQFGDGFNCLVGGLGQGKSTVLLAFDFVLFGDPLGRSYDYLLREDAKEGKVTAVFVQNGKTYKIQRALKRRGKGINQDIDQLKLYRDGKLVASNKNDAVAEELKTLTGLDKNIFREIVWVRQEHLKELIDTTPRQRQKKLDELFGLSDYETAWAGLQLFQRTYEGEKNALERDSDIIRSAKIEGDYCKAVEEFSYITSQLGTAKQNLNTAESDLSEATYRLDGLEELRKTTETLQRKEIQLQTNLNNLKRRARELVAQNEADKKRFDEQEKIMEQMQTQKKTQQELLKKAGFGSDRSLEDIRRHLFDVDEQLRNIGGEQQAIKREMLDSTSKISRIITENKCPRCLQELTGDYKKSLKENLKKEQNENEKRLTELQTTIEELKSHHSTVNGAFSSLQQLVPRIEDLQKQITEKQESLTNFSTQLKETKDKEKRLQKQLDETKDEIAKFDVSELESARKRQKEAIVVHLNAKNELKNLEGRKADLGLRVDELKERLDNVQRKIERKGKIEKLLEIIDRIRVAYRSIQPKLRSEFVTYLQMTVQQVLDSLTGDVGPALNIKIEESYSPLVSSEEGYEREVANLSGGERTLLAFAYRIGLGQLIMQSRTGHGLYMLLLDEPTESLGREDGSVERLAEAVSRLKAIEQIIAVTHNESFAEKAEHVIRIEKESGSSQVHIEK